MTQEEKQLLLKDLCARLPYNVMVDYDGNIYVLNEIDPACKDIDYITVRIQDVERLMYAKSIMIENIKPYLRPMSSMTEKEREELSCYENCIQRADFYYSHHIDCRFMIEKGLALEATEDMYKNE